VTLGDDLEAMARVLRAATRPADLFGPCDGADLDARLRALGEAFRLHLARVHPDRYLHNPDLGARAVELCEKLGLWRDLAERQLRSGARPRDGRFVEVRGVRYVVERELCGGDVCDLFVATRDDGADDALVVIKAARAASDNDLLDREFAALGRLWGGDPGEVAVFGRYLPRVVGAATLPDGRRVNLLSLADGYVSLAEVVRAYPAGVDGRTACWMGNRVLELLAWVHRQGVIHGAVTPDHVLVHPVTHGCTLVDWCYAVCDWAVADGPHLPAVPRSARSRFPAEVFAREPASPRLDLYVAAGTLLEAAGVDLWNYRRADPGGAEPPIAEGMVELLRGCRLPRPADRFGDAFTVYERWRDAQLRAYGPRRYHPFTMPAIGP